MPTGREYWDLVRDAEFGGNICEDEKFLSFPTRREFEAWFEASIRSYMSLLPPELCHNFSQAVVSEYGSQFREHPLSIRDRVLFVLLDNSSPSIAGRVAL